MKKNRHGFTLVELMIAVAIVGILMSIAYPSYIVHVQKGRRVIAQGELMAFASAMEQFFVQNGSDYRAGGVDDADPGVYASTITIGGVVMYDIESTSITETAYTLKATPKTGTLQEGNGFVRINSLGTKAWNSPNGLINHW